MLIPGKRSRRAPKSKTPAEDSMERRPGRPMKHASELGSTRTTATRQARQLYEQRTSETTERKRASLSTFERLPVEIIQHIFFNALEVNLPRSSQYLCQVLSQQSIYNALILLAYFCDDREHAVESRHFRPAEYRCLSEKEQLKLQRGILSCRWCTFDRLRSCMPVLCRLKMVQAWHAERHAEDVLDLVEPASKNQPHSPSIRMQEIAPLPDISDESAMERHFAVRPEDWIRLYGPDDYRLAGPFGPQDYLPYLLPWSSSGDRLGQLHKTISMPESLFCARVIPDAILTTNPWTQEGQDLLQLLREGSRYGPGAEYFAISAQALFEGMSNAIREQKPDVLLVLMELHAAVMELDPSRPGEGFDTIPRTGHRFTPPHTYPIPLDLFHLATKQSSCSAKLISLLIRGGLDSIPRDDDVMTTWAVRAQAKGDPVGKWLLQHMEGTNDYGLMRSEALFVKGALSWRRSEGEYPFPDQSFDDEIKRAPVRSEAERLRLMTNIPV